MERKKLELIMSVLMILCAFALAERGWQQTLGEHVTGNSGKKCVVIDAGHGGNDPGKIGVDDSREKDLNLVIADKVKRILEQQDIDVIMTRETDTGLYEEDASNKKVQDLKKRVSIINENQPDCVISIHQNSFPDASVSGPQVFYFEQSTESSAIASVMQDTLNNSLNPPKPRVCKSNNDYYILKKTPTPIIIVECGFLSNETEAALLVTDAYHEKLVRAVYLGAITYLESGKVVPDTAT